MTSALIRMAPAQVCPADSTPLHPVGYPCLSRRKWSVRPQDDGGHVHCAGWCSRACTCWQASWDQVSQQLPRVMQSLE